MAKEKGKKKKLSAKAFTAILAPFLAILLAFSIALPVITTSRFDLVLRDIFGEAKSSNKGGDATANVVCGEIPSRSCVVIRSLTTLSRRDSPIRY